MSAQGFYADVEELATLASQLESCTAEMRRASRTLQKASPRALGNNWVDISCNAFQSSWSYGIEQIRDMADAMSDGLRATARSYNETEQAIRDAFGGNSSRGGTPDRSRNPEGTPFG